MKIKLNESLPSSEFFYLDDSNVVNKINSISINYDYYI